MVRRVMAHRSDGIREVGLGLSRGRSKYSVHLAFDS